MMLNTYLFDLDGTLVDPTIYSTIYKPIIGFIKSKLRLTSDDLEVMAKELGLVKKENRWDTGVLCYKLGLLENYYSLLEAHVHRQSSVFPEGKEIISYLASQHKRIGIVSNSMRKTILTHLHSAELMEYVSFIFSGEDAGTLKHDELYWKTLITQCNISPPETIMLGDNDLEDIIMPGRVGIVGCRIRHPSHFLKLKRKI